MRTFRGRRGGREEERMIKITLLPEAWGMSPKEVSSSLFDCWNMLSHWENCSFLTCSGEFYCGYTLAIYVYKCMCTHTFMHTIKSSMHVHQDSWILENRLFSEQLELVFIDRLLRTGHSLYDLTLYFVLSSPRNSHLKWLQLLPPYKNVQCGAQVGCRTCSHSYSCSVTEPELRPSSDWLWSQILLRMVGPGALGFLEF